MTTTLTAEPQTNDVPAKARKPLSEKRLAANRANALKSTGPKTENGKCGSRRNALKLGLTGAGVVLPADMEREVDEAVESFAARLHPIDDYDWRLVRQAAIGSVRFERLVQVQEANILVRRNNATRDWDDARAREVEALAALLEVDPDQAVRGLKRITEGADFLCDAWDALETRLDRTGCWDDADLDRAVRLLGWNGPPDANDSGPAVSLTFCALGLRPDRLNVADQAAAFFDIDPETALDLLSTPEESLDGLLGAIRQQKSDLRTLADTLWDNHDALDRATAPDRALVDLSPEGRRLHRYDRQASAQTYRALREFDNRRKQAAPAHSTESTACQTLARATPPILPATAAPPAQNEPNTAEHGRSDPRPSPAAMVVAKVVKPGKSPLHSLQYPEATPNLPPTSPPGNDDPDFKTICMSGTSGKPL